MFFDEYILNLWELLTSISTKTINHKCLTLNSSEYFLCRLFTFDWQWISGTQLFHLHLYSEYDAGRSIYTLLYESHSECDSVRHSTSKRLLFNEYVDRSSFVTSAINSFSPLKAFMKETTFLEFDTIIMIEKYRRIVDIIRRILFSRYFINRKTPQKRCHWKW